MAGTWLQSKQSLRMDLTGRWRSQAIRETIVTVRASSGRRSRNEVFHRNFEYSATRESRSLHFLSSTCKRQARCKPSTVAIHCGGQARAESTIKPAVYNSSSQIHANSSSTTHTLHRSRPELAAVFPNRTRLCFRSQQIAHGRLQISCTTDDMANGRPRAKKYRDSCRRVNGHFAQCFESIYFLSSPISLSLSLSPPPLSLSLSLSFSLSLSLSLSFSLSLSLSLSLFSPSPSLSSHFSSFST